MVSSNLALAALLLFCGNATAQTPAKEFPATGDNGKPGGGIFGLRPGTQRPSMHSLLGVKRQLIA
jgi:hypothetical protein